MFENTAVQSSQYQWNIDSPHPMFLDPLVMLYVLGLSLSTWGILLFAACGYVGALALLPLIVAFGVLTYKRSKANSAVKSAHRQTVVSSINAETGLALTIDHLVAVAMVVYGNTSTYIAQDASRTFKVGGRDVTVTMLADGRVSAVAQ